MSAIIDASVRIREGMPVYPDNPEVSVERVREVEQGASSTLSRICLGTHTGTHVDTPMHFIAGAPGLDDMRPELMVGPARVLEMGAERSVSVSDLEIHDIREGERILLKTRNSELWSAEDFRPDYVFLQTDAARHLAERRISLLGIDYLSVGGYKSNGREVHHALLEAGVYLVEGLDLSDVAPGDCEFFCLPLRISGAEGAPARALVRQ